MKLRFALLVLPFLLELRLAHAQRTGGSFGGSAWGAPTSAPPSRPATPAVARNSTPAPPRRLLPVVRPTVRPAVRTVVTAPVAQPRAVAEPMRVPSARTAPVRLDQVAPRVPEASEPLDPVDCAVGHVGARGDGRGSIVVALLVVALFARRGCLP